jgi:transposase
MPLVAYDRLDAQTLARLARVDPQLLRPIRHRSEKAQAHLMSIRVRAALVETRTRLVNTVGERLPSCDTDQMGVDRGEGLPRQLLETLEPLLEEEESLTEKIKERDAKIEQIARSEYPETATGRGSLAAAGQPV